MKSRMLLCALLLAGAHVFAESTNGLKDAVILVIRHAEKPASGNTLTPAGEERAKAYVHYFQNYTVDSKPVKISYLFAAADSKGSMRPRLTLEPLSKAMGMAIDQHFTDKQAAELADELRAKPHGGNIIICWHHGQIPALLQALGANPNKILPGGKWPESIFGWAVQLRYGDQGQLVEAKLIKEKLMPDDAGALYDMPEALP